MKKTRRIINVSAFVLSALSILTPLIVVMSMWAKDCLEYASDVTEDRRKFLGVFLVFYLIIWIKWASSTTLVWINVRRTLLLIFCEKRKLYKIIFSSILLMIAVAILVPVVLTPSSPYLTLDFIIPWLIYAVVRFVLFVVVDFDTSGEIK